MNQSQYMLNQIGPIIVKVEKIVKENTRNTRNTRNTHLIFRIPLFFFALKKGAQEIEDFHKHKKRTKHKKPEF